MKKILFLLSFLLGMTSLAHGQLKSAAGKQQKIYINLANGEQWVKNVWEIESITFGQDDNTLSCVAPDSSVDLGLSVAWAPFNLGASSPKGSGYLVGWGDITGQNCSTNNKYFPMANPTGNITSTQYDLAKLMWEGEWRMPTSKEMNELIDGCNWTWVEQDDSIGFLVTSKTGDGEIFLPATGIRKGTLDKEKIDNGFYWSGNLASDNQEASFLHFADGQVTLADTLRYLGLAIRPVYGKLKLGLTLATEIIGTPSQTSANIAIHMKGDLDEVSEYGILYGLNADELTKKIVTGSSAPTSESFQATLGNLSLNTTYYYTVYAVTDNQYSYSDTLSFTTQPKYTKPTAAVDLGLSVKWSPWNMGAGRESDEGLYLAWGDPTGENPDYSKGNELENIAGTDLDIAHAVWGGKWRMPSQKELQELANLTWTYKEIEGVSGYTITGTNGNSIWLPVHGYKRDGTLAYVNSGYYWSSETDNSLHPGVAQILTSNYIVSVNVSDKTWGMFIRPVYDDNSSDPVSPEVEDPYKKHAVDLGLSCYWSDCNLGAKSQSELGDFYAWGETEPKTNFSKDNYTYTDVNEESGYQVIGTKGKLISETEYDAAKAKMGGKWHMPTIYEIQELEENCTWEEATINGVSGYRVTGPNGNHIFLPYTGYMTDALYGSDSSANYWSGTIYEHGYTNQWGGTLCFSASSSEPYTHGRYRYQGCAIRPVKTK